MIRNAMIVIPKNVGMACIRRRVTYLPIALVPNMRVTEDGGQHNTAPGEIKKTEERKNGRLQSAERARIGFG
jgi:hypothetical protein